MIYSYFALHFNLLIYSMLYHLHKMYPSINKTISISIHIHVSTCSATLCPFRNMISVERNRIPFFIACRKVRYIITYPSTGSGHRLMKLPLYVVPNGTIEGGDVPILPICSPKRDKNSAKNELHNLHIQDTENYQTTKLKTEN